MRKPRILQDGARYHVAARANRREMLLASSQMKELFLDVLTRAKKKYDFNVENFCIMGNHIHLILQPLKGTNLSALMQWILSVFAMAFNRAWHSCGHVWGERFFSRIINGFWAFTAVFAYIDKNPERVEEVKDPRDWRYGGLGQARQGHRGILGEVPLWVRLPFPNHTQLLLL